MSGWEKWCWGDSRISTCSGSDLKVPFGRKHSRCGKPLCEAELAWLEAGERRCAEGTFLWACPMFSLARMCSYPHFPFLTTGCVHISLSCLLLGGMCPSFAWLLFLKCSKAIVTIVDNEIILGLSRKSWTL